MSKYRVCSNRYKRDIGISRYSVDSLKLGNNGVFIGKVNKVVNIDGFQIKISIKTPIIFLEDYKFGQDSNNFVLTFNTGLIDKNHRRIYEGDIIKFNGDYYKVVRRGRKFIAKNKDRELDLKLICLKSEVFGNIFNMEDLWRAL